MDSIEAKKHGVRWGMPHGEKVVKGTYDLSRNLAKFGHSPSFWKRRLEIVNEKPEPSKVCFNDTSAFANSASTL